MANYASVEHRSAQISSEFGNEFARRVFGDAIVDALPKVSRGPRKGETKGTIQWEKCTKGGWSNKPGRAGVRRPGASNVRLTVGDDRYPDPRSFMTEDCYARWCALGKPAWSPKEAYTAMEERWGAAAARRERVTAEFAQAAQ